MKYAVFTAIPYVGHLNPLLQLALELQRRGWRVAIAQPTETHAHIAREAPELPVLDLGALGPVADLMRATERAASDDPSFVRGAMRFLPMLDSLWPPLFDGLVRTLAAERPDLLVVDIFSWAGFDAAEVAGVPIVVNNPSLLTGIPLELMPPAPHVPFAVSTQSIHDVGAVQKTFHPLLRAAVMAATRMTVGRRLNAVRRRRGLPPIRIHDKMRGRPILVNGAFPLDYERPLPPNVHMTGPLLPAADAPLPADLAAWLDAGPVIYVNLGTVVTPSRPMLEKILAGAMLSGARVLWVMRPEYAALLPPSRPPHVRVESWVPSTTTLLRHPHVRAFVSHCGINSVYESVAAGTPIVGIPFLADQRDMAVRLADAGVGLWLDKAAFTADDLRAALQRVLHEPSFRDRLPALQDACARAGGVRGAADIIERAAGVIPRAA